MRCSRDGCGGTLSQESIPVDESSEAWTGHSTVDKAHACLRCGLLHSSDGKKLIRKNERITSWDDPNADGWFLRNGQVVREKC